MLEMLIVVVKLSLECERRKQKHVVDAPRGKIQAPFVLVVLDSSSWSGKDLPPRNQATAFAPF
jgi:hypothetical protein